MAGLNVLTDKSYIPQRQNITPCATDHFEELIPAKQQILNTHAESTLSVLIFRRTYFRKLREFWSISQNFLLNGIRENNYTPNMHKIYILRKKKIH